MTRPVPRTSLGDLLGIEYPDALAGMGPVAAGEMPRGLRELIPAGTLAGVEKMAEDLGGPCEQAPEPPPTPARTGGRNAAGQLSGRLIEERAAEDIVLDLMNGPAGILGRKLPATVTTTPGD